MTWGPGGWGDFGTFRVMGTNGSTSGNPWKTFGILRMTFKVLRWTFGVLRLFRFLQVLGVLGELFGSSETIWVAFGTKYRSQILASLGLTKTEYIRFIKHTLYETVHTIDHITVLWSNMCLK